MKADATVEYKRNGITVLIRPTIKEGVKRFVVDYRVKGQRKLVWRSTLTKARQAASDAIDKIVAGQSEVLELTNTDAHVYLRARDTVAAVNMPLDHAAREYVDAIAILGGKATLIEAARFWLKAHDATLPSVTVEQAVEEKLAHAKRDGKSKDRQHQLRTYLDRLKDSFNCNLTDLTSAQISEHLAAMQTKDRTKKNCRDVLAAFLSWCEGRGYLPKGQDLIEHVQSYRNKKRGGISTFTPDELSKFIVSARSEFLPYILIQAFAGLRGAEIQRMDWRDIDLADGFIEVRDEVAKQSDDDEGLRRLVPIQPNLKAWLLPIAKKSGPVCPFKNIPNELNDLAKAAGVAWRKNALRHSCISYRVADIADVPRIAEESGNSPAIIRKHYLKRVKPQQAKEWFNIMPAEDHRNILQLEGGT